MRKHTVIHRKKIHLPDKPIACRNPPKSSSELHNAYELWKKCSERDKATETGRRWKVVRHQEFCSSLGIVKRGKAVYIEHV